MFTMLRAVVRSATLLLLAVTLAACGGGGGGPPPDTTPPVTVASPPGGDYASTLLVTLTASEPATIYYSLDGNDPGSGQANTFSGPSPIRNIVIQPGRTILKFFAIDGAGNRETIHRVVYAVAGASGTWIGHYQSERFPSTPMRIDLTQVGSNVTGTYADANGVSGTFEASVSGSDFSFTVTSSGGSCPGSFDGNGTINGDTFTFVFSGTNCLGLHQNGHGSVTRQAGKVLAFGLQTPARLVLENGMLFWSESGEEAVRRLPVGGGTPQRLARKLGVPTGLLYADGRLYWLDSRAAAAAPGCGTGNGRWRILHRSAPDGTATETLSEGCVAAADGPNDLVSDGLNLYWILSRPSPPGSVVERVPLDGSAPSNAIESAVSIRTLRRDSSYLYWTEQDFPNPGRIMRMPLGGGSASPVYDAGPSGTPLVGPMATNGTVLIFLAGVYPYPFTTFDLFSVPVSGGTPTRLATLNNAPLDLAIDGTFVYGIDVSGLYRVPLGGGNRVDLGTTGVNMVRAVIDTARGEAAWLNATGDLYVVPLSGGASTRLATGFFDAGSLAFGPDVIYVTEGDRLGYGFDTAAGQIRAYDRVTATVTPVVTGVSDADAPIAAAGGSLFIADGWRIKRVGASGGPVEIWQVAGDDVLDLATDGSTLYWLEGKAVVSVRSRPVAGSGTATTLATTSRFTQRLTTDRVNLYWLEGLDTLRRIPVTGGTASTLVTGGVAISGFFSDGNHLYFAEQDTGIIKRVPVDGGGIETLTGLAQAFSWISLAGDATDVYWLDQQYLGRIPKSVGTPRRLLDSGLYPSATVPGSVVVDATRVYWTEAGSGTLKSLLK